MHQCLNVCYFGLIFMFSPDCRAKKLGMLFTILGSFAHFWIGKGPIFCPRIGLGKSLQLIFHYLISHRLKEYDVKPTLSLKIMENK